MISKVFLFGATTLIGNHFIDINNKYELVCFSSKNKKYNLLDLKDENTFSNFKFKNAFIVSFAPIWLLKNLIIYLERNNLDDLKTLKGLIVFSSTSVNTKMYASNQFDKMISKKLKQSEDEILSICKNNFINCRVVRPTIIYGVYKKIEDANFSQIIKLFRKIPFCFVPNKTGYRQPIHFSQLSKLTYFLLNNIIKSKSIEKSFEVLEVGGDEELTYKELLFRIVSLNLKDHRYKFRLITIPNKLFLFLITPFLIFKPRVFDSLYRIQADLSGFTKCSDYLGEDPKNFPIDYL